MAHTSRSDSASPPLSADLPPPLPRASSATAVYYVSADGRRLIQVDHGFQAMFGYSESEVIGRPWKILHAADEGDPATTVRQLAHHMDETGAWAGEIRSQRKDGSRFWSFVSIAVSDHPTHGTIWIAIHSDRTEPKLAEDALRQSEERLHRATAVNDVGVWEWDLLTDTIYWDDRMFDMFDLPRITPFRYECWVATLHPEDRERAEAALKQLLASETRVTCEYRILLRNGDVRSVQAEGKSWLDASGRVARAVGVNVDVTHRRQVEATLRDSEEKFAKAFYRAPVFMSISTLDTGTYLDVNEHARVLTGFTREEMIGHTSVGIGLIAAGDRQRMADLIARHGHIEGFDLPFTRKDGVRGISRVHADSLTLSGRRCLLLIAIDITESRRADEQIRQLSQAVEQSPSSVVITDPSGNIEYVNPKFEQVSGYTLAEVKGRNPRILKSGDLPPQAYQKLWQTITAGGTWRGMFHNRSKNGESRWEDATISPIRDASGTITHYLAVKEDLTARKQLEDRYRHSQKMEAVGQLAGGLAHDYNNILTATMMQLGLLQDDPGLTPSVRSALRELERLATRSARITRQLLTFSRQQPIDVAPLEFNELLKNLLGMLRHLLGENIKIDFPGHPTPLWTVADAGMIEQLVTNLAVNARDAMTPQGGTLVIRPESITLDAATAELNPDAYPGRFVRLSVIDTGCGMSAETQKRIFEPFFTTKEVGKGTGLGLATVFGIVQQHRGWIEVDSAAGRGSTFQVYLPALDEAPAATKRETPRSAVRGVETILVVEDEAMVRRTTVAGLESYGYRVLAAGDGVAALALWTEHAASIDLLLTDMVMPGGLSGLDLALRLRQTKPTLRVIVCSGYSRALSEAGLARLPDASYLAKPFELTRVASLIRNILDQA